jgi:hypothetical protein
MFITSACIIFAFFLGTRIPVETEEPEPSETTQRRRKPKSLEQQVEPPTHKQLAQLRDARGIREGSLQFKKRGAGVYQVQYEHGKYRWVHLGSWIDLKQQLEAIPTS